jgi:HEAT repeat protein
VLWIAPLIVFAGISAHPAWAESDSARVARLFVWASAGEVQFAQRVQPAKDSLAAMGATAARWLAFRLWTSDARERLALADIYQKIGPTATPYLVPCLDSSGEDMPTNAARCLGRIADTAAVIPLLPKLNHRHYRVRSEVATTLGKIKDKRSVESLLTSLREDDDSDVRKSAAVALGAIGDARATAVLISALNDPFFGVRVSAQTSLTQLKPPPVEMLIDAVSVMSGVARYSALVALGGCADQRARKTLLYFLQSQDPYERGFAVEGLSFHPDKKTVRKIAALKRGETDPFVRAQIDRALR